METVQGAHDPFLLASRGGWQNKTGTAGIYHDGYPVFGPQLTDQHFHGIFKEGQFVGRIHGS